MSIKAAMSAKADNASVGIVRYPNRCTQIRLQGFDGSQATARSRDGTRSTSTCQVEIDPPARAMASTTHRAPCQPRHDATASTGTSGYMAARWYQHRRHGTKCATSLK